MPIKVAFIGAGSIGFTRGLLGDLLTVPEFNDIEIAFTDINEENLSMVTQLCQRDIDANGLNIKIHATLDRRQAFKDANYIINVVRIGMLEAFELDVEIPLKYGVDQCVGDTLCAGGIIYGQRGIHAMLEFCKDIREVSAPGAIMLNYANPNAMVTWACNKYGGVKTIGLCHGVYAGHVQIAELLKGKLEDVHIICAGINHQTWYTSVMVRGKERKDELLELFEKHPVYSQTEKVRIDMLKHFGLYSTESNGHLSEYVAWYRKRPDEIKDWVHLGKWIDGETGGYLRVCRESRNWFETDFPNWMKEEPRKFAPKTRGHEHGSYIIESLETGRVYRGFFNVVNNGAISNLPDDAIVEVPGYVDMNGISIPQVGDLPLGCAAILNNSISVQRLAVEAAVHADIQLLRQAMLMDPLTGAVLNPAEIYQMVDELLIAEEEWLPQYKEEIARAKQRIQRAKEEGTYIGPKPYTANVRLQEKSIEEMAQNRQSATEQAGKADK